MSRSVKGGAAVVCRSGKANDELIALVARQFACRKSAVTIKSGAPGRMKLVRIEDTE